MTQGSRIRKLIGETAVYGVASVAGRLVTFLLVPFYTQFFPPDEYGVVILVYTAFIFLNVVYTYGQESAYLKFASGPEGRSNVKEVFTTATASLVVSSVLLSTCLVVFRYDLATLIGVDAGSARFLYYAAAILLIDTLCVLPLAELRLQNRAARFASVRLVAIVVNVLLNVYLIAFRRHGIEAIFVSNVVSSGLTLLLLLPVYSARLTTALPRGVLGKLLRFGLPFLPGGLGYALADRINLFFLARLDADQVQRIHGGLFGGESVDGTFVAGVFGTAWKLGIFMMLVTQMFRYAWQPFFLNHAHEDDARALFARVFTLFTAGAIAVFLAISFTIDDLVAIPLPGGRQLIDPAYWTGLYLVPYALLAYIFQGWYYNFSVGAYVERRSIYFVYCTLAGGALALIVNALFVPRYGMTAAALATVIAYAVMALMLLVLTRRVYSVPYAWGRVGVLSCIAATVFFAWKATPGLQVLPVEIGLVTTFMLAAYLLVRRARVSAASQQEPPNRSAPRQ